MKAGEFFSRFAHDQEIGRDITETQVAVFYDNGKDVGCWREDRRSTVGAGSVLGPQDAEMARHWYQKRERPAGAGGTEGTTGAEGRWLSSVARSNGEPQR